MVKRAPQHLQHVRALREWQLGHIVGEQLQDRHEWHASLGGMIVQTFTVTGWPGFVRRPQQLGARVLAEFGDAENRYASAKARKNYAGDRSDHPRVGQ